MTRHTSRMSFVRYALGGEYLGVHQPTQKERKVGRGKVTFEVREAVWLEVNLEEQKKLPMKLVHRWARDGRLMFISDMTQCLR